MQILNYNYFYDVPHQSRNAALASYLLTLDSTHL